MDVERARAGVDAARLVETARISARTSGAIRAAAHDRSKADLKAIFLKLRERTRTSFIRARKLEKEMRAATAAASG